MQTQQASTLMIIGAILWGTNPALIQLIDWTPFGTAWIRGGFCALLLLGFIYYKGLYSRESFGLQSLCAFFLAVNSALFVAASLYTSPANAVLLLFVFPWVTLILDFFILDKRPLVTDILRLLLGLTGITIIVWNELDSSQTLGNTFALMAGFCIAFNIFFSQRLEKRHNSNKQVLSSVLLAWVMTLIFLAPLALVNQSLHEVSFSTLQVITLLVFGLFSAIPWLIWGATIAYIPGHVLAALLGIEVFAAALFGWLLLGDLPSAAVFIGGGLTLIAATWQILSSVNQSKPTSEKALS